MIIDSREENSFAERVKNKNPVTGVEREFIEIGDVLLDDEFAIEIKRKDLISSITSNRLFDQLNSLMNYEHPILCIVLDDIYKQFYFSNSRWIHKAYRGTLTTLAVSYPKLKVFQFQDEDELVEFLIGLDKKIHKEGSSQRPSPIARKPKSLDERRENMLCMIEGLGVPKAKLLLKQFGGIYGLCSANMIELQAVDGIGKKLALNIWNVLHEEQL